ncbi:MAG: NAD(P)H-dependent oxidoreductase [Flavobacterium sp. BFFFF1]|uniref:nitroreductase family protein n=1 Tax=Flavobacterium sp. BFFFF1 TaxID=2015557 RepID=UPI000BD01B4C|nr:nitroreductase family protein [Flavobacterium sp. BFFFF1]OYU79755.1 MAG: NAD(P)H-dependent oxidoreductase [Flavobacterium sp. BFFFF1]
MSITAALQWRYAAKRMNGTKIPESKMDVILDAIALAPSSFGLQPYSVLIVENKELLEKIKPIAYSQPQITEASALVVFAAWDKLTKERISIYVNQIAQERGIALETLAPVREQLESQLANSDADNFNWHAKQTYIALAIGLVAAAEQKVDSTPMEGFNSLLLDDLLQLQERGLRSTVIMALGYRDVKNDYLVNLKKIRRPKDALFIHL